jgi:hypothetical protein
VKVLHGMTGTWHAQVKMYEDPSKPPQESTATVTGAMVMEGRFLEQKIEGKFAGGAFKGLGITGYDPIRKMYSMFWIDSVGNQMMVRYGTFDAKTKTFTFLAEEVNEFSGGKKWKTRDVMRLVNDNEHIAEMFVTPEGGKEFKMMEIKYTRKTK